MTLKPDFKATFSIYNIANTVLNVIIEEGT